MKKVLIVGAGSIGTLFGVFLIKSGFKVTFAGRVNSKYTEYLKNHGLSLLTASGKKSRILPAHPQVRFVDTDEKLQEQFDLIIVALKSNCLSSVAAYINAHANEKTIIVHAQNGIPYWWFGEPTYFSTLEQIISQKMGDRRHLESIDPQGIIYQTLGDRCLVGCVVKAPCGKTDRGLVEVRKSPRVTLGLVNSARDRERKQEVEQLGKILTASGLVTEYSNFIRAEVCNKLAINVTTNVLSALTGCLIAELTANSHTQHLIEAILKEINQIFTVYGIASERLPSQEKLYSYIKQPGSQRHLPSLAQDFAKHRQGEVSLITTPVEMAKIAKISVPTLASLAVLLKLGQQLALARQSDRTHLLTFNDSLGIYVLGKKVRQTINLNDKQIAEVENSLIQINQSARSPKIFRERYSYLSEYLVAS